MEARNENNASETTSRDYSNDHVRPKFRISITTWLQLVGINLVTMASDLSASAGFSLLPPMMLKQGFSETVMTITVGIGPCISMFLVHFIGHWSDHCRCRFGKRRPFILGLSVFTLLALIMIPYCKEIGNLFNSSIIGTAIILGTGAVVLDFSSQAILNPCKSLVSDFATGSSQDVAFSVYSAMYSIGGCIGYLIPALHWESSIIGHLAGSQEKSVFDLLFIIFLLFVVVNLVVAKEKPSNNRTSHKRKSNSLTNGSVCQEKETPQPRKLPELLNNESLTIKRSVLTQDSSDSSFILNELNARTLNSCGDNSGKLRTCDKSNCDKFCEPGKERMKGLVCCCASSKSVKRSLESIPDRGLIVTRRAMKTTKTFWYHIKTIVFMPVVLRKLFLVNVICWMSIMTHSMFYSDFVGQAIYAGDPLGDEDSHELRLYDEGVRMGSWGLMIHCIASALYAAFIQDRLIDRFGQRCIIIFGMLSFTFSMVGTIFSPNLVLLNIWAAISGLGYAAVTSVPYNILSAYHRAKEVYFPDSKSSFRGMGEDMAILDSAYNFSQIIPSLFVGYLVHITGTASTYLIVSAVFGAVSCVSLFFITYPTADTGYVEQVIVQPSIPPLDGPVKQSTQIGMIQVTSPIISTSVDEERNKIISDYL